MAAIGDEQYGLLSAAETLQIRDQLVTTSNQLTDAAVTLMKQEPWSLFLATYGAPHRGGHKLWDDHGIAGDTSDAEAKELAEALKQVYMSCDRAVGRLLDEAGDGDRILRTRHGTKPLPYRVAARVAETYSRP